MEPLLSYYIPPDTFPVELIAPIAGAYGSILDLAHDGSDEGFKALDCHILESAKDSQCFEESLVLAVFCSLHYLQDSGCRFFVRQFETTSLDTYNYVEGVPSSCFNALESSKSPIITLGKPYLAKPSQVLVRSHDELVCYTYDVPLKTLMRTRLVGWGNSLELCTEAYRLHSPHKFVHSPLVSTFSEHAKGLALFLRRYLVTPMMQESSEIKTLLNDYEYSPDCG